jgi:5-methylcytosine-specific restriction endonuclease McrA
MGKDSVQYAKANKPEPEQQEKPQWNAQERRALKKIKLEAKAAGATLKSDGEGGLRPSLALGVFRKGGWKCSNEDCPTPKKDLDLDHVSGHAEEIAQDPKARKRKDLKRAITLGHVNKIDALHILCARCHSSAHDREREIDAGKKPDPMPGEKGSA